MYIHELAANGLTKTGHHGPLGAMGVSRDRAPAVGRHPVRHRAAGAPAASSTTEPVGTEVCIGPNADKPLWLDIPLFVSDMSFGALSQEAKTALAARRRARRHRHLLGRGRHAARGAGREQPLLLRAGVGPLRLDVRRAEEGAGLPLQGRPGRQDRHRRPPARRQGRRARSPRCAACPRAPPRSRRHASPTGTRSTTSAASPTRSARSRAASRSASSSRPSTSRRTSTPRSSVGVDYVILDGRGGGTGAAPLLFRDNISVPDDPGAGPGPRPPRPARPARRHARRHRRAAPRARLRQGARARRRRRRGRQLGDPGHRLPRHAGVQHQQLPGRHRHPEAAPAGPAAGRRGRAPARPLPARDRRAHAGAGPGVRARAT